jgi:hypothetical protein
MCATSAARAIVSVRNAVNHKDAGPVMLAATRDATDAADSAAVIAARADVRKDDRIFALLLNRGSSGSGIEPDHAEAVAEVAAGAAHAAARVAARTALFTRLSLGKEDPGAAAALDDAARATRTAINAAAIVHSEEALLGRGHPEDAVDAANRAVAHAAYWSRYYAVSAAAEAAAVVAVIAGGTEHENVPYAARRAATDAFDAATDIFAATFLQPPCVPAPTAPRTQDEASFSPERAPAVIQWGPRIRRWTGLNRPMSRFLDDWGIPQMLRQLVIALPILVAVEYAFGDDVLPHSEVMFLFGLAGGFCYGWRSRKDRQKQDTI